ncbi:hypothetical protein NE237_027252 [Protea cynaroides]|uniref:Uncharacterized protein n=1 Tax=Protea cynaroides TaxID=273540 RepID=A0A9Q0JU17_9MAGN|nr:hypothetical protein NE237_027252 [Protea cynaroides]
MPFLLSLSSFLNGVIWVIYALLRFDPFILVGNFLGAIGGLGQLILYGMYYKSTPKDEASKLSEVPLSYETSKSDEVQLSNDVQLINNQSLSYTRSLSNNRNLSFTNRSQVMPV